MRFALAAIFLPTVLGQYAAPTIIAMVEIPGLDESSGLVASRKHRGIFWSHNDGEGGPYLYAFDRAGKSRGKFLVSGAGMYDWEDIAIGPRNHLYVGDIGDNARRRKEITIYRIPEPHPSDRVSAAVNKIRLRYPNGAHDAEALL